MRKEDLLLSSLKSGSGIPGGVLGGRRISGGWWERGKAIDLAFSTGV